MDERPMASPVPTAKMVEQYISLTLTTCTLSGNICGSGGNGANLWCNGAGVGGVGGSGAGVWNSGGPLTITACTLVQNLCGNGGTNGNPFQAFANICPRGTGSAGAGAGMATANAMATLENTIIALNTNGIQVRSCAFTNFPFARDVSGAVV